MIDGRDETTDAAGMQQQTVYTGLGLELPLNHTRQSESTAEENSSAGSVGASDIFEGTADMDVPRNTPKKK
jgi:hypothetical protein